MGEHHQARTKTKPGPAPVRRSLSGPDLSPARARLLEHLQQLPDDVTVDEVAASFGQHPNTVREHLDALAGLGLVLRESVPGPGRGRPAWHYRANPNRPEPDPRVREYGALAEALAAHLAAHSAEPRAEARSAGKRWGRAAVEPPSGAVSAADARRRVVRMLEELDFGPRANQSCTRVVLTTCPLLDVAERHAEVVCTVHEGMVVGALDALGAPSEGASLTPFSAQDGCRLTLPTPGTRMRR